MSRLGGLALAACLALPISLAAQVPVRDPNDTLPSADSTSTDSSATERLLAVEGQARVFLNTLPRVTLADVQPAGSRIVLTRDSIDWAPARTVGELIGSVAPAYLWRGGWRVRPEVPNVLGHGATSVEYLVDGRPWLPIGPDSVAVDPSTWALAIFDRVEIEQEPARLRVYLYTRIHDRLATNTAIAVSTGDRGLAQYFGLFEKRYASGLGLSLAADYTGVNAPEGGSGGASVTNGWAQLSWLPSPRFGAQLQYLIQAPKRDVLLAAESTDTLDPGLDGRRSDLELRLSWRNRPGPLGLRADAWAARSGWTGDTARQEIGTFGTVLGYRRPTWSSELQVLHHTEWTPLSSRLAFGWTPTAALSAAIEGNYQKHEDDRRSAWATARVGLEVPKGSRLILGRHLPVGLRLGGTVSHGERVEAPALADLQPASFSNYEVMAAIDAGFLTAEGRLLSTDAWTALPYRQFSRVVSFERQPRTEWLTARARLAPLSWLAFATNYQHPLGGKLPDGVPPHHAWTTATINSRFLHNFPSGIFRLQVQGVVETWSPGTIGRDVDGAAIALPGLTFVRGVIEFQIGPFTAYWDRVNFQATRQGAVPGYPILSLGSSYGIRWRFDN